MAAPTQEQVTQLEKALADQFYNLVQGANLRVQLAIRFGLESKAFVNYNKVFAKLVNSWVNREVKYEKELLKQHIKGIISSGDLKYDDFFVSASLPKLNSIVQKWTDKKLSGMGWIPLLIWAVIAIAAFFTAATITDDLTTTAQEKTQLLNATNQVCADASLTADQCKALLTQTQAEAGGSTSIMDIAKWGILAYVGAQLFKSK